MAVIHMRNQDIGKMVDHSQKEGPKEACGILAGRIEGKETWISKVYECQNVHVDPEVEYLIDPKDQVNIFQGIDKDNEIELVGFYHSHPSGPNGPSQIDASRNYWPDYLMAIISLSPDPNVSFWKWKDGRFFPQELVRESF